MKKKPKRSALVLREVVKIVEIDPILVGEEEMWFRIEVCREPGRTKKFTARTWRFAHYKVDRPGQRDEQVLVDSSHLFEEISGTTAKQVIDRTVREIETRFLNAQ